VRDEACTSTAPIADVLASAFSMYTANILPVKPLKAFPTSENPALIAGSIYLFAQYSSKFFIFTEKLLYLAWFFTFSAFA